MKTPVIKKLIQPAHRVFSQRENIEFHSAKENKRRALLNILTPLKIAVGDEGGGYCYGYLYEESIDKIIDAIEKWLEDNKLKDE